LVAVHSVAAVDILVAVAVVAFQSPVVEHTVAHIDPVAVHSVAVAVVDILGVVQAVAVVVAHPLLVVGHSIDMVAVAVVVVAHPYLVVEHSVGMVAFQYLVVEHSIAHTAPFDPVAVVDIPVAVVAFQYLVVKPSVARTAPVAASPFPVVEKSLSPHTVQLERVDVDSDPISAHNLVELLEMFFVLVLLAFPIHHLVV
jgi:hypothetical protein